MIPIANEDFYCLVATDGTPQLTTLASDLAMSVAFTKLMHKAGMGESFHQLKMKGFTYQKVTLTLKLKTD